MFVCYGFFIACVLFFFFKQKTAYEMRISDWSSDVCSSDLLMAGDVTVAVDYSTINYKDGMALTGRSPVIQTFPLIGGIDLAGTVEASTYPGIEVGDRVVANGWGLSQTHHGGYAQKARLSGDWLVQPHENFFTNRATALGTAGYPARLAVLALAHGGNHPRASR